MPVAIASELVAKQEIGLIAVYLCKAPTHPLGIYRLLDLCVNDPVRLASARDRHAFVGPMLRDVADC